MLSDIYYMFSSCYLMMNDRKFKCVIVLFCSRTKCEVLGSQSYVSLNEASVDPYILQHVQCFSQNSLTEAKSFIQNVLWLKIMKRGSVLGDESELDCIS